MPITTIAEGKRDGRKSEILTQALLMHGERVVIGGSVDHVARGAKAHMSIYGNNH